jgi:hypothetical protein
MKSYPIRNLRLAIVDDDLGKSLATPHALIDLCRFLPSDELRLCTLEVHCRNAAVEKRLSFDLCSIDVNFQEDIEDPARPLSTVSTRSLGMADPAIMTASGLYHGMALLGRRAAFDSHGNLLPLAWEVRSATPRQFATRADLRADALRGYALLRSLLARPMPGEALECCLRREYLAAHSNAVPLAGGSLAELFEDDLRRQDPSSGFAPDILGKLLPRWRRMLLEAVENRELHIDVPEMKRQVEKVKSLGTTNKGNLKVTPQSDICVPVLDTEEKNVAYGIRLTSIMADLVAGGRIATTAKTERLADAAGARSMLAWCSDLVDLSATRRRWPPVFRRIAGQFQQTVALNGESEVASLWEDFRGSQSLNKRMLLYIIMRVRLHLTKAAGDRDPPDIQARGRASLSGIYGINSNVQTFLRPATGNELIKLRPAALRSAIKQALAGGEGELVKAGIWDGWLAAELRDYALRPKAQFGLQMDEAKLRALAPGLFR